MTFRDSLFPGMKKRVRESTPYSAQSGQISASASVCSYYDVIVDDDVVT